MSLSPTGLALALSQPTFGNTEGLVEAWYDQTFTFALRDVGSFAPRDICSHLRRSFLGALGRGASREATLNLPCPWDPPCAFDVFGREQLRGPRGDGLTKPFVLHSWVRDGDLMVALRIFGMANDWGLAAADALVLGMREILPWPRVLKGNGDVPEVTTRSSSIFRLGQFDRVPSSVRIAFLSPMDASGADMRDLPHSLLTRMIRRVDAMSRWNGVALCETESRVLSAHAKALEYNVDGLRFGAYASPNRKRQKRVNPTIEGRIVVSGDLAPVWPILQMGTRTHVGRHAVEGLGAFDLEALL